VFVCIAPVIDC